MLQGQTHRAASIAACLDDERLDDAELSGHLAEAVRLMCVLDPAQKPVLRGLAAHEDGAVLYEVIQGLDPTDRLDRAVLEKLLRHRSRIAELAREKLAAAGEVPFWIGSFETDPLAGLPEAAARRLLPTLQRWAKLQRKGQRTARDQKELARLLARMPRPAALGAFRATIGQDRYGTPFVAFLAAISRHAGAEEAACDALAVELRLRPDLPYDFGELQPCPLTPGFRRRFSAALLRRLAESSAEACAEIDEPAWSWAHTLNQVWPPGDDPRPVVDLLLSWGDDGDDEDATGLHQLVGREGKRRAWTRTLVDEAFAADGRGQFRYLWSGVVELANSLAARTRLDLAEAALTRHVPGPSLEWALRELAKQRPELVRARYDDPVVRPIVFTRELVAVFRERARADLRAGKLLPGEAGPTLFLLRATGDCVDWSGIGIRRKKRAGIVDGDEGLEWVPDSPASGLTEEDWAGIRIARSAVEPGAMLEDIDLALHYPPGAWHEEDLRFFKGAFREALDGGETYRAGWLATVASFKPHPELLPLVTEAVGAEDVHERDTRAALARLRAALGLASGEDDDDEPASDDDHWDPA